MDCWLPVSVSESGLALSPLVSSEIQRKVMGLFNWLWGRPKPPSELDMLGLRGPTARTHHYIFAHKLFPSHIWNGDSVLGILANPENQEFTVNIWNELGQKLEQQDRLPPAGLRHSSHWIGGEHLAILVELPAAKVSPEAQFIAILTSPKIRYLTLEKTIPAEDGSDQFVIAEWMLDGGHGNFGLCVEPTATGFLKAICHLMSLPETVEPPTSQQLQGMRRGGPVIDVTMPKGLPEEEERKVEAWEQEAEAALQAKDLPRAEQLYRQVLELRMSRQGPENTIATLAHSQLAQILRFQGKHQEAEELCRTWWRYCRRHRMLGHAETMAATRALAECLQAQGKREEAADLMSYRVLFGGLTRGGDSMIADQARSELAMFQEGPV